MEGSFPSPKANAVASNRPAPERRAWRRRNQASRLQPRCSRCRAADHSLSPPIRAGPHYQSPPVPASWAQSYRYCQRTGKLHPGSHSRRSLVRAAHKLRHTQRSAPRRSRSRDALPRAARPAQGRSVAPRVIRARSPRTRRRPSTRELRRRQEGPAGIARHTV